MGHGDQKDHDDATHATPDEVRALSRRIRLIARRFQIVHVMQGPETLEVFKAMERFDPDESWNPVEQP